MDLLNQSNSKNREQERKEKLQLELGSTLPYIGMDLQSIEFTSLGTPYVDHQTTQKSDGTFTMHLVYRWYFDYEKRTVSALRSSYGEQIDELTFYGEYEKYN